MLLCFVVVCSACLFLAPGCGVMMLPRARWSFAMDGATNLPSCLWRTGITAVQLIKHAQHLCCKQRTLNSQLQWGGCTRQPETTLHASARSHLLHPVNPLACFSSASFLLPRGVSRVCCFVARPHFRLHPPKIFNHGTWSQPLQEKHCAVRGLFVPMFC